MFSKVCAGREVQVKISREDFQQLRRRGKLAPLDNVRVAANRELTIKDCAPRSVRSGTGNHQVLSELRAGIRARPPVGQFSVDVAFASEGRVTGLFGPSGSGKTSLVSMIAGLMTPDRGVISVDGEALDDTFEMDIFSPIRQDWLDGTDTYFHEK